MFGTRTTVAFLSLIISFSAATYANEVADFQAPSHSSSEMVDLLRTYSYVDPLSTIPTNLKTNALAYFQANQARFANKNYVSVVDFSANAKYARLFIINMKTGAVLALHVAHGKNSDTNNDGFATQFSNVSGSDQSSLGYYATAETYSGEHGLSLRLDGLSSTNSNVRARDIVVHGATYVYDTDTQAGRSWGCFAVPMDDRDNVVSMLKGGSLLYAGLSQ